MKVIVDSQMPQEEQKVIIWYGEAATEFAEGVIDVAPATPPVLTDKQYAELFYNAVTGKLFYKIHVRPLTAEESLVIQGEQIEELTLMLADVIASQV